MIQSGAEHYFCFGYLNALASLQGCRSPDCAPLRTAQRPTWGFDHVERLCCERQVGYKDHFAQTSWPPSFMYCTVLSQHVLYCTVLSCTSPSHQSHAPPDAAGQVLNLACPRPYIVRLPLSFSIWALGVGRRPSSCCSDDLYIAPYPYLPFPSLLLYAWRRRRVCSCVVSRGSRPS